MVWASAKWQRSVRTDTKNRMVALRNADWHKSDSRESRYKVNGAEGVNFAVNMNDSAVNKVGLAITAGGVCR